MINLTNTYNVYEKRWVMVTRNTGVEVRLDEDDFKQLRGVLLWEYKGQIVLRNGTPLVQYLGIVGELQPLTPKYDHRRRFYC